MKKLLFFVVLLATPIYSATGVKESATGFVASAVSISSNSATAIPATALAGRFKVIIQNTGTYDVYIGSHSGVTTANGFLVSASTAGYHSKLEFPVPSGKTIYGLAESHHSGSATIRILEIK
jgi:hypothetical protein